ncbi:MAG TPA: NfeD family protein [Actinomycetota bacterium]|nr:NfeD family protein [Actinomycetota bacterium]
MRQRARLLSVPVLMVCGLAGTTLTGAALAGAAERAATAPTTPVRVIEVQGPIDRPLLAFLEERLAEAERAGAIVVLQLNTPGMLGQDGLALADRVAHLEVPVLTWVGPVPAKASGGGLLLMLASSLAGVAPGSQTGPLRPVDVLRPEIGSADLRSRIEGWLALRGRPDVDLDAIERPLAAREALAAKAAHVATYTVPEFLIAVDGMTVRTPTGAVELRTRVATTEAQAGERTVDIRFEEPGLIGRVLHAVATPSMVYLLLVLGLAAIAFELTQPGFGFAGFSGVALAMLAGYGLTVAVPSWGGLALLVLGIGLLVLDVRLRSLRWPTWAGLVAFGAGSILAWRHVDDSIAISPWLIGGAVLASLLYYGFALTVALQSRDRIVGTQRGLVGLVGEARGRLAPDGPVFVKGALWRGRTDGDPIEPGTPIRVRGVDGLILRVAPELVRPMEDAGA